MDDDADTDFDLEAVHVYMHVYLNQHLNDGCKTSSAELPNTDHADMRSSQRNRILLCPKENTFSCIRYLPPVKKNFRASHGRGHTPLPHPPPFTTPGPATPPPKLLDQHLWANFRCGRRIPKYLRREIHKPVILNRTNPTIFPSNAKLLFERMVFANIRII